jgi:tetratricopeptide (TPR) repeat protein
MKRTYFIFCILFLITTSSYSQDDVSFYFKSPLFSKVSEHYKKDRFDLAFKELQALEEKLNEKNLDDQKLRPVMKYLQGMSALRVNDFPASITAFEEAIKLGFESEDIYYEYGQALYANENYPKARAQFVKSFKRGFKKAVSLYYIAYISKELKDTKRAYKFLKRIESLPPEEAREVLQASRMQLGDLLLEKAQDHPDEFRMMEEHVIPQYEKALEVDKSSGLASIIQEKIITLQRKYDLLLFQLRNGRPVLRPPYFLRLAQELGVDSNVVFNPNEASISRSKQSSEFSKTDFFGRYTFYLQDFFSIAPEVRANNMYYFNRVPEIYRNDTRYYSVALRSSYEHEVNGRPAATLLDFDYNETLRDINQEKKLKYNSSSYSFMLGQRLLLWDRGETVARLRYRKFDSYSELFGSSTWSASLEQVVNFSFETLLFYASYDRSRVKESFFDTDSFTLRADLVISRFHNWFVPVIGVGLTRVEPKNSLDSRGVETLVNPGVRLIKKMHKNWNAILRYDYQKYDSKDNDGFAYRKTIYGLEVEYLF